VQGRWRRWFPSQEWDTIWLPSTEPGAQAPSFPGDTTPDPTGVAVQGDIRSEENDPFPPLHVGLELGGDGPACYLAHSSEAQERQRALELWAEAICSSQVQRLDLEGPDPVAVEAPIWLLIHKGCLGLELGFLASAQDMRRHRCSTRKVGRSHPPPPLSRSFAQVVM
jgi:hypothetical protein